MDAVRHGRVGRPFDPSPLSLAAHLNRDANVSSKVDTLDSTGNSYLVYRQWFIVMAHFGTESAPMPRRVEIRLVRR
jgi:hypothetical protein